MAPLPCKTCGREIRIEGVPPGTSVTCAACGDTCFVPGSSPEHPTDTFSTVDETAINHPVAERTSEAHRGPPALNPWLFVGVGMVGFVILVLFCCVLLVGAVRAWRGN